MCTCVHIFVRACICFCMRVSNTFYCFIHLLMTLGLFPPLAMLTVNCGLILWDVRNSKSRGSTVEGHVGTHMFSCHLSNCHRVSGAHRAPLKLLGSVLAVFPSFLPSVL